MRREKSGRSKKDGHHYGQWTRVEKANKMIHKKKLFDSIFYDFFSLLFQKVPCKYVLLSTIWGWAKILQFLKKVIQGRPCNISSHFWGNWVDWERQEIFKGNRLNSTHNRLSVSKKFIFISVKIIMFFVLGLSINLVTGTKTSNSNQIS